MGFGKDLVRRLKSILQGRKSNHEIGNEKIERVIWYQLGKSLREI